MAAYGPIVVYCILAFAVVAVVSATAAFAGRTRAAARHQEPYECGISAPTHVGPKISVRFYVIAMLFVVLDVEAITFYPWAVHLRALGSAGLADMAIFGVALAVGYAHVWKKGGLDWR